MVNLRLLKVIRPHIVGGGFLGYLVSILFSLNLGGRISATWFTLGYLIVLFEDLSTHYNNDYYDVEIDSQAPFKPFGSTNIFVTHPELRHHALIIAIGLSVFSLLLASVMIWMGSSPYLLVVVFAFNLLGWLYSAPPVRLHSRRLGEVTIAFGTGFCIPAVGYILIQGTLDATFAMFSFPLIIYGLILSLCLQLPDYEIDRAMNKKTVVGLISIRKTYLVVLFCAITASVTYLLFYQTIPLFYTILWASLIPLLTSSFSVLFLSDNLKQAQTFTKLNISALFLFLIIANIALLLTLLK